MRLSGERSPEMEWRGKANWGNKGIDLGLWDA